MGVTVKKHVNFKIGSFLGKVTFYKFHTTKKRDFSGPPKNVPSLFKGRECFFMTFRRIFGFLFFWINFKNLEATVMMHAPDTVQGRTRKSLY